MLTVVYDTEGLFGHCDCTLRCSYVAICFTLLSEIKHKNIFLFCLQQKNFSVQLAQ